jgi:hypothetical protein
MLEFVQLEPAAAWPLKLTMPTAVPKFNPAIVTLVPAFPLPGVTLEMKGPTMKLTPLLCSVPAVVTLTFPVVAELGTLATMLVSDQLVTEADWPLKLTDPVLLPKWLPEIVTAVPATPADGLTLARPGRRMPNHTPALASVPAVTTTLPLLAALGTTTVILVFDQLETVADWLFRVTVPVDEVKFFPAMVTEAPGSALVGVTELMMGTTVNGTPLLDKPPEVLTTIFPVLAPAGTYTWMVLSDQFEMLPAWPLNVTVPELPGPAPK